MNLFPGNQAAKTTRETNMCKVSSCSASCSLSQERGRHFSGLPVFSSTPWPPLCLRLRRETKAPEALASQAELGGLARKVVRICARQASAREPAPQRPPGETSEPPEERTKEATNGKDNKTRKEHRTGPGDGVTQTSLSGFTHNPKG